LSYAPNVVSVAWTRCFSVPETISTAAASLGREHQEPADRPKRLHFVDDHNRTNGILLLKSENCSYQPDRGRLPILKLTL